MALMEDLKNILFASRHICYLCREERCGEKAYICPDCHGRLDILNEEIHIDSPYISKTYYSLSYNRFIREKIRDYKFNGKNYLYKPFGEIMVETARKAGIHKEVDLICYIPSHRRKEALRGYNQAELLGRHISRRLGIPLSIGNLIKIKWTKDQSGLNRLERKSNLGKSFRIKDEKEIRGKKILLIDDIITTGGTLEECSRVLIEKGVKNLVGLTLTSTKI